MKTVNSPWQKRHFSKGIGLIEVVLSVTLITLALSAFSAVFIQNVKLQLRLFQMKASIEVEELLESWLAQKMGPFFESLANASDCQTNNIVNKLNDYLVTNYATDPGYDVWVWANPNQSQGQYKLDLDNSIDSRRKLAVTRCNNDQTPFSGASVEDQNGLYLCLRLVTSQEFQQQNFYTYPTFVEIYYAFRDFESNAPLKCENYVQNSSLKPALRGGAIFYTLYSQCDASFVREGCLGGTFKEGKYGRNIFSGVIHAFSPTDPGA